MRRRWMFALATLAGLAWGGDAAAHDGHEHDPAAQRGLRTWTHAGGRFRVRGALVALRGEQVQVRGEDGELFDIRLAALGDDDRAFVEKKKEAIERLNNSPRLRFISQREPRGEPAIARHFKPFGSTIKTRIDDEFFYVESNGMPDHPMMIGITAWQQQVPLPQSYTGENAWRIPLHPVPANRPLSAKDHFFRGAIALAVNGVPIFNPIKNDGRTDTFLAGELDRFGGHCGRADDYHYHIAPVHLEPKVGKGQPLAYALDGYAIYGFEEPDGSKAGKLDRFNGHEQDGMAYHYHATKAYPYLNGGFHGEVTERAGQVDPQPRAEPVREALPPLRGAVITDFRSTAPGSYRLIYQIRGKNNFVDYTLEKDGSIRFQFLDSDGESRSEVYRRGGRPGGGGRGGDRPSRGGEQPSPREEQAGGERSEPSPIMRAIDKDGDGELSMDEVAAAPKTLMALDRVKDGKLSDEELRPAPGPEADRPAPPEEGDRPRGQGGPQGRKGPDPNDPDRKPWIQVHSPEMDKDKDGTLTRAELTAEVDATFTGYDRDKDGMLSADEYGRGGVRSAMGGFVQQHSGEIDRDGDGVISKQEIMSTATRMFDRSDRDGDGSLSPAELAAPERQGGGRRPEQEKARRKGQGNPQRKGQGQGKAQTKGQGGQGRGGQGQGQGGGRSNLRQTDPNEPPPFHTTVPKHEMDVILGRPTDRSMSLSVISYENADAVVYYGKEGGELDRKAGPIKLAAGRASEVVLEGLSTDAGYRYRIDRKGAGAGEFAPGAVRSFRTQRAKGRPFAFTIQADSHLDLGCEPSVYLKTLENAQAYKPDFHIELGDTFMTDKFARYQDSASQYVAQRYYFGSLCHSVPLFFVLGNHDGEAGSKRNGTAENMAVWSANMRKRFLPNPYPDAFYTGNGEDVPFVGKLGNYYAFTWGDAQIIVLDPFWYTTARRVEGEDFWARTLGERQYRWLEETLKASRSKFKFVFIHHLVGGGTREARGGSEASRFFEWGGKNLDGTEGFATRRPGWGKPIHELLVEHGVSAVFHGHDHFYAHQERDGVAYQLVPQPGNRRYGTPRSAEEYGYREGVFDNGPGFVGVRIGESGAAVDYVLTVLPEDERGDRRNGRVAATYTIKARGSH